MRASQKLPIYKTLREEVRWGAGFPVTLLSVLRIGGKCSRLRAKTGHISRHLPIEGAAMFLFLKSRRPIPIVSQILL